MDSKFKENLTDIFFNYKTIILLICIILSSFAINYNIFQQSGVVITSVSNQKELFSQGLDVNSDSFQRSFPKLTKINGVKVRDVAHAYELFSFQKINSTNNVTIENVTYKYFYNSRFTL